VTDEPAIEQLLEPSTVLSHALDFMETDLDADAYNVISAWVARAIREISEDLARVEAIDPEALEGLPAARMKIEGGKLWVRILRSRRRGLIEPPIVSLFRRLALNATAFCAVSAMTAQKAGYYAAVAC